MRTLMPVRFLVVAALAVSATVGTWALAGPAGAGASITCTALSGQNGTFGSPLIVSGCSGPTGGSGFTTAPLTGPNTFTWAGGGTTTVSFTLTFPRRSKCPGGALEASLRGNVTVSTGQASGITGLFTAKVCVDPNAILSLLPGKRMRF